MGVFEIIPPEGSMHVKDIAAKAGADEALISTASSLPCSSLMYVDAWK
jgi:hypothetical protein